MSAPAASPTPAAAVEALHADKTAELAGAVEDAFASGCTLTIEGGRSKHFYGRQTRVDRTLNVGEHTGIVNYDPSELVVTARAGTPLAAINDTLAAHNQQLPFDPPRFSPRATIGGCVAAGLSGCSRPHYGSVRDHVLGVKIINGKGEVLAFGGQVVKNVAGYDLSRLMVGALGLLGVLLEVSLRTMPAPPAHRTLSYSLSLPDALDFLAKVQRHAHPLSATAWHAGVLYLRASGDDETLKQTAQDLGGDAVADGDNFWQDLRDHRHAFFTTRGKPLWRLATAPLAAHAAALGTPLVEWGGAVRWTKTDLPMAEIQTAASPATVQLSRFYRRDAVASGAQVEDDEAFSPLAPAVLSFHQRLKDAFDPKRILNPGRMYKNL